MKIATWNVNSIKVRKDGLLDWLGQADPDVVALQEIKCVDENFPSKAFEEVGYTLAVHGQKTYNGVALLSKHPMEDIRRGLPGNTDDDQARYIEALITPAGGAPVRVGGLYAPNGNPAPGKKYTYKLDWTEKLIAHAQDLLATEESFALIGDYNIIPRPEDVHAPEKWADDALFFPESRALYRRLCFLGLTDAIAVTHADPDQYTFWDYQGGAWPKNNGIRIDHLMLSPQAADRLEEAGIDRQVRGWEKASDHVPVWCRLH